MYGTFTDRSTYLGILFLMLKYFSCPAPKITDIHEYSAFKLCRVYN